MDQRHEYKASLVGQEIVGGQRQAVSDEEGNNKTDIDKNCISQEQDALHQDIRSPEPSAARSFLIHRGSALQKVERFSSSVYE